MPSKMNDADVVVARGVKAGLEEGALSLEIKDLGCLGVVANMWDELGLTELLDRAALRLTAHRALDGHVSPTAVCACCH